MHHNHDTVCYPDHHGQIHDDMQPPRMQPMLSNISVLTLYSSALIGGTTHPVLPRVASSFPVVAFANLV